MRITRKRRIFRQRPSPFLWLMPTILVVTSAIIPVRYTWAAYQARAPESRPSFSALSASSVVQLESGSIDLGLLKPGERVCKSTTISNISNRMVTLTARIVPVNPDEQETNSEGRHLEVQVIPSMLQPGENATAEVSVTGHVQGPAEIQAYVELTAFNGFIRILIPVTGTVEAPPPVKPPVTKPCEPKKNGEPDPNCPTDATATSPDGAPTKADAPAADGAPTTDGGLATDDASSNNPPAPATPTPPTEPAPPAPQTPPVVAPPPVNLTPPTEPTAPAPMTPPIVPPPPVTQNAPTEPAAPVDQGVPTEPLPSAETAPAAPSSPAAP